MLKAGAELGFSPSSRTRVQVESSHRFDWLGNARANPGGLLAKPWQYGKKDEFFGD